MHHNKRKIIVLGNRGFLGSSLYKNLQKRYASEVAGFNSSSLDLKSPNFHDKIINLVDKNTTIISMARASTKSNQLETFNQDLAITINIAKFLKNVAIK